METAIIIVLEIVILLKVWHQKKVEKPETKKEKSKVDIFNKWMYGSEPKR